MSRHIIASSVPILTLCLLLAACSPLLRPYQYYAAPTDLTVLDPEVTTYENRRADRLDWTDYVPDTTRLAEFPVRYLRVNFHFLNTRDTLYDLIGEQAEAFVLDLLIAANKDLATNTAMYLPHGNQTPTLPVRYQMLLQGDPAVPGDRGIYHHFDDEHARYVAKGKHANLASRTVIEKYGVRLGEVLNIFVIPTHPDSMKSATHGNQVRGIALTNAVKITGVHGSDLPGWYHRGNLNHEVGHILTLAHTWAYQDGCDDTPQHTQDCWSRSQSPRCDTMTSNNVMDYVQLNVAWTPCQIGRMHRVMADENSRQHALLEPLWCDYWAERTVNIGDTVHWRGHRDLQGDIVIESGGYLRISGRVSLAQQASIYVRAGGVLELSGGRLHNACAQQWEGIVLEEVGNSQGRVLVSGDYRIENVRDWPSPEPE